MNSREIIKLKMQQDSTDNITLTTDRRTDRATCTSSNTTAECQKW